MSADKPRKSQARLKGTALMHIHAHCKLVLYLRIGGCLPVLRLLDNILLFTSLLFLVSGIVFSIDRKGSNTSVLFLSCRGNCFHQARAGTKPSSQRSTQYWCAVTRPTWTRSYHTLIKLTTALVAS
ncbi:hypothetical protein BDV41DRAFT_556395 [Aspergillus transmontanensis]|uniref:Uncharacterized protein n=1 Tax=Aspergillus transmontanensis TaxID=1034304 RepID=A0A5N6VEY3_9EURO|nr:hypothetical protein BDV41DRAFT_556395 [Aspergillus transmontanensis]